MKHAYPLIRNAAEKVPAGIAVQWGNYEHTNPKTGKRITVPEFADFAATNLNASFIFWSTQDRSIPRNSCRTSANQKHPKNPLSYLAPLAPLPERCSC